MKKGIWHTVSHDETSRCEGLFGENFTVEIPSNGGDCNSNCDSIVFLINDVRKGPDGFRANLCLSPPCRYSKSSLCIEKPNRISETKQKFWRSIEVRGHGERLISLQVKVELRAGVT